ncbi:MFS transporter [Luteipulveratus mongoliensis]|nr:MFS transporter [Luteipulveratus mongoliensis]
MTSLIAHLDLGAPWRLLRRRRDLRLLVGAGLVSMTGDWLLAIGLTYSVYALTGSTLASAATLLAGFVPQVLAGLVAGVFVDRWDRRRTMVIAHVLLAAGLLPLFAVQGVGQVWIVFPVLIWESAIEVFFAPAEQAMLPRVVEESDAGELITANALNAQSQNVARLVGGGLGGVVAAVGGIPAVAVVDAITFLIAGALVLAIKTSGRRTSDDGDDSAEDLVLGRLAELRAEWTEGLRVSWGSPTVRVLLVFCLITSVGEGIMGTLFAPFVRSVLHGGPQALGLISGIQAVGGVVGALVVATFGGRWSPRRMLGCGALAFGVVDLVVFLYPLTLVATWPAAVGMVVVGLPGAIVSAGMMTLFQQHSTDRQRGRVFALVMLARSVAMVVGTTAAGFLGEAIGIMPVLACQGVGYVVAGSMVLICLERAPAPRRPLVSA